MSTTKRWAAAGIAIVAIVAAVSISAAGAQPSPRTTAAKSSTSTLVAQLAAARVATAKYVSNLNLAKESGYGIITKMIPNMGYHYMNPKIAGFNIKKPPILVYEHTAGGYQLAALEWVFTSKPATPPIPGAKYGSFGAGCHYKDGTFVPAAAQTGCPTTSPQTGATFNFWHPVLITLHVWLWYPNPSGLFASTNPLAAAFNQG